MKTTTRKKTKTKDKLASELVKVKDKTTASLLKRFKTTKMIYVASPYSYYSGSKLLNYLVRLWRYKVITREIGLLQNLYPYSFIGPITQSHNTAKFMENKGTGFADWALRDLTYISHCDEVWVIDMPGALTSVGVKAEINYAFNNKIKIVLMSPTKMTLLEKILLWVKL